MYQSPSPSRCVGLWRTEMQHWVGQCRLYLFIYFLYNADIKRSFSRFITFFLKHIFGFCPKTQQPPPDTAHCLGLHMHRPSESNESCCTLSSPSPRLLQRLSHMAPMLGEGNKTSWVPPVLLPCSQWLLIAQSCHNWC